MNRKIISLLFIICSSFLLSNTFKNIENFKANVVETTIRNNKKKVTEYNLKLKFPDLVFKKVISPKINKGEQYIYNKNKKTIYYPMLNQTINKEIDEEENQILEVLKDLRSVDKEGKINILEYENGNKIIFNNYKKIDGINFPTYVEIYEKDSLISTLEFDKIQINISLNEKDFKLDLKD